MIFPGQHMPDRTKAEKKARSDAYDKWAAEEAARVRRQRLYLTAVIGPLRNAMIERMLERAWFLLDANECEAADALLEFVPEADADKLLREYFDDE